MKYKNAKGTVKLVFYIDVELDDEYDTMSEVVSKLKKMANYEMTRKCVAERLEGGVYFTPDETVVTKINYEEPSEDYYDEESSEDCKEDKNEML